MNLNQNVTKQDQKIRMQQRNYFEKKGRQMIIASSTGRKKSHPLDSL
jgi:hypothetical protein